MPFTRLTNTRQGGISKAPTNMTSRQGIVRLGNLPRHVGIATRGASTMVILGTTVQLCNISNARAVFRGRRQRFVPIVRLVRYSTRTIQVSKPVPINALRVQVTTFCATVHVFHYANG